MTHKLHINAYFIVFASLLRVSNPHTLPTVGSVGGCRYPHGPQQPENKIL